MTITGEGSNMLFRRPPDEGGRRSGRSRGLRAGAAAGVLLLAASLTAIALAASAPTVSSSSSAKLKERIVVNAQGRTLYWLHPETTYHLLCKTSECFKFWPPLTVGSASAKLTAGPGVHGSLGILHRDGFFQVTLRGEPLYRYSEDHAKGQVNGQGIPSFGGTWYAVTAAADPKPRHRQGSGAGDPASGTPGGSSSSSSGGGYESSGDPSGSGTSMPSTSSSKSTSPSTTTTGEEKPTSKEEKTTPQEEKTTPKEEKKETQAEKETRETHEKEAQEKAHKEYCEAWPTYCS